MPPEHDLVIPRRLAIRILHEAQVAQPASIRGLVGARDGEPASFSQDGTTEALDARGETPWARLWSHPDAPAVPTAEQLVPGELALVVSLDTKGVLELRAWELRDGVVVERVIKVRD